MLSIFLVSLLFVGIIGDGAAGDRAGLLNSGCYSSVDGKKLTSVFIDCNNGPETPLLLPANFDVDLLPENISTLRLSPLEVGTGFVALPARPQLTRAWFFGRRFRESPTFPLNALLANNKDHIESLYLSSLKLVRLTRAMLSGFRQLNELTVSECLLEGIDVDAFVGLAAAGSPAPAAGLKSISITYSPNLGRLDWAFLAPVKDSVQSIDLYHNNITAIVNGAAQPFLLKELTALDLSRNPCERTTPLAVVKDTLTPALQARYNTHCTVGIDRNVVNTNFWMSPEEQDAFTK